MENEGCIEKEIEALKDLIGLDKRNLSSSNCILNSQERFHSINCSSFPLFLQIELTNRCNLKCVMCGVINRKESTLPLSSFRKLWKTLPYIGGMTWLGGEVFLVDYFFDLLKAIHSEFPHIDHTIYSNGLLIDDKIASILADINTLQLKISMDSVVKETYEQIRSLGKFNMLLNSLSIFKEAHIRKGKKPNFGINVIAMRKNMGQLILYPDFCKKYGMTHLDISFLADDADPPHMPEENIFNGIDQAIFGQIKSILREIKTKCREYGISFFCNFDSFVKQADNEFSEDIDLRRIYNQTIVAEQTNGESKYGFRCYYPWTSLFIKCNGLVVPTGDCKVPIGNILKDDFSKIWNGRIMQLYRDKLARYDLSKWCAPHCQQKMKVNKQMLGIHS